MMLKALSDDGRRCVIATGDFNITADAMEASGILEAIGMTLIRPSNATVTCHMGKGSLIDYALITTKYLPMVLSVMTDEAVPWAPHTGLRVRLRLKCKHIVTKEVRRPKPYTDTVDFFKAKGLFDSMARLQYLGNKPRL